ncbi:hypothetical protein Tco_1213555 [Tanacetum coccineum]
MSTPSTTSEALYRRVPATTISDFSHHSTPGSEASYHRDTNNVPNLNHCAGDGGGTSMREMITSQLQGKLWLYDEVQDRLDKSPELSVPRETSLRGDVTVRAEGISARVVVETIDREEADPSARGPVEVKVERITHPVVPDDIPEPAQEGAADVVYETLGDLVQRFHDHTVEVSARRVQVIESIQRDQGSRIVATGQQSVVLSERTSELERDNTRLRGTLDVASQRVSRLQQRELRVRREIRQIRRF